jgi:hypothetical protein
MWIFLEQTLGYPLDAFGITSYSVLRSSLVRYFLTGVFFSKVVEKKEENAVINRHGVTLSINPILIH